MQRRPGPITTLSVNLAIVVSIVSQNLASDLINNRGPLERHGLGDRFLTVWPTFNRVAFSIDIVNCPGNRVSQIILSNAIWIGNVTLRIDWFTWRGRISWCDLRRLVTIVNLFRCVGGVAINRNRSY